MSYQKVPSVLRWVRQTSRCPLYPDWKTGTLACASLEQRSNPASASVRQTSSGSAAATVRLVENDDRVVEGSPRHRYNYFSEYGIPVLVGKLLSAAVKMIRLTSSYRALAVHASASD